MKVCLTPTFIIEPQKLLNRESNVYIRMLCISTLVVLQELLIIPSFLALPSTTYEQVRDLGCDIYKESRQFDAIYQAMDNRQVTLIKNESTIPYVVFVLGETTSRHYMGAYGHLLNTTPFLDKRRANQESYVFTDVVSSHSVTIESLENMFTFYRVGALGEWYDYTDLFHILTAAGYHSYWISNQEVTGIFGFVGQVYADMCSERYFTTYRSSKNDNTAMDTAILPELDRTLADTYAKKFYVLHLMGGHQKYTQRYPADFNLFTKDDEQGSLDSIKGLRAQYDNAVLYNDYVVNEIIKRFEDKNAIVIYVPDHGEDIYDVAAGYGHKDHGTFPMIEIPMTIWTSQAFKAAYPGLNERIAQAVDKPFMTDDMIHVILDVMDIATPEYDPSKSLINEQYDSSRQRIYDGVVYEKQS